MYSPAIQIGRCHIPMRPIRGKNILHNAIHFQNTEPSAWSYRTGLPMDFIILKGCLNSFFQRALKLKFAEAAQKPGLKNAQLIEGTEISTMAELTNWVVESDKVLTF
jgi:hypothetical protein